MKFPNLFQDRSGFTPNTLRVMLILTIIIASLIGLLTADNVSILGMAFSLILLVFFSIEAIFNWERKKSG